MGHQVHVLCQSEHPTSHLTANVWHNTRTQTVILGVVAPCMTYHCWVSLSLYHVACYSLECAVCKLKQGHHQAAQAH